MEGISALFNVTPDPVPPPPVEPLIPTSYPNSSLLSGPSSLPYTQFNGSNWAPYDASSYGPNRSFHLFPSSTASAMYSLIESGIQMVQENLTSPSTSAESSTDFLFSSISPEETVTLFSDLSEESLPYETFLKNTRFIVQRVLVPILMIIGGIGNSITIVVMTRRRMRSSTNNYLAALATFDMLYLVFIFILSLKHYPNIKHDPLYNLYRRFYPFYLMVTDCCSNSSVWLTVTFTIERFIVVSHPIKGKIICTESRSRKVVLAVFLFCFAVTLPTPFEWDLQDKLIPDTNLTILEMVPSSLGKNAFYKTIYSWLTAALFVFIPLILLTVFNAFLIRSVHISQTQRSHMTQSKGHSGSPTGTTSGAGNGRHRSVVTASGDRITSRLESNSSKQETKITVMLIAVVILFLLCQLPAAIMLIFDSLYQFEEGTTEYHSIIILNNIFNFLVAINAAGNFLLYCFFSQRYRKTFLTLFCPCYRNKLGYFQSTHPNTIYSKKARARDVPRDSAQDPESQSLKPGDGDPPSETPQDLKVFPSSGSSPRAPTSPSGRLNQPSGSSRSDRDLGSRTYGSSSPTEVSVSPCSGDPNSRLLPGTLNTHL